MYRIIDGRGTGKTSRLFLIAKENNATVVCSNPDAFRIKAYSYGITGLDFLSYDDLLNGNYQSGGKIVVDELAELARYAINSTGVEFIGYSLSDEE